MECEWSGEVDGGLPSVCHVHRIHRLDNPDDHPAGKQKPRSTRRTDADYFVGCCGGAWSEFERVILDRGKLPARQCLLSTPDVDGGRPVWSYARIIGGSTLVHRREHDLQRRLDSESDACRSNHPRHWWGRNDKLESHHLGRSDPPSREV